MRRKIKIDFDDPMGLEAIRKMARKYPMKESTRKQLLQAKKEYMQKLRKTSQYYQGNWEVKF
jgi:hypothetical protein